jgi:molybdopterin molybdotransferase
VPRLSTLSRQDSNLLATLAEANVLIVRPPHAPEVLPGATVEFVPLD